MPLTKQGDETEAGCVTVDQVRVSARANMTSAHLPDQYRMAVCSQDNMLDLLFGPDATPAENGQISESHNPMAKTPFS